VTCPSEGDSCAKARVIPHEIVEVRGWTRKAEALREGPAAHQLVGRVMAYQGEDG
jgi:hypothetical protein